MEASPEFTPMGAVQDPRGRYLFCTSDMKHSFLVENPVLGNESEIPVSSLGSELFMVVPETCGEVLRAVLNITLTTRSNPAGRISQTGRFLLPFFTFTDGTVRNHYRKSRWHQRAGIPSRPPGWRPTSMEPRWPFLLCLRSSCSCECMHDSG